MSLCGGWSIAKHQGALIEARTLFCRAWTCPDCGPRRASALSRFAVDGAPTTFLTLTVNPAVGESPDTRAQALSDAFKVIIKRARRRFTKEAIEYLAVFEETKRGEPHLHILLRAPFIPQRWLSEQMNELISAPVVDIRRVGHKRNAARYVAKYVGKGPKPFAAMKRYWSSKGYDLNEERRAKRTNTQPSGWCVVREPLWFFVETTMQACFGRTLAVWRDAHNVVLHGGRAPP